MSGLTVQQTDILPSLLDYLNYDKDYVAFGQSVFDSISDRFAISYLSGVYQMIQGDYAFEFDGEKDISLFNYKIDSLLSVNLIHQEDSITTEMGKLSRAIVQQYNNRMIHNELTVKE